MVIARLPLSPKRSRTHVPEISDPRIHMSYQFTSSRNHRCTDKQSRRRKPQITEYEITYQPIQVRITQSRRSKSHVPADKYVVPRAVDASSRYESQSTQHPKLSTSRNQSQSTQHPKLSTPRNQSQLARSAQTDDASSRYQTQYKSCTTRHKFTKLPESAETWTIPQPT